ncbi:hypothetical protein Tcan_01714 [Toxocara canis]|uniref:Uncharacterized protein n=1 Tax=Toxocara canis TaxID=6265 RepID=A0A0B2VPG4_TOXCA|nr:hypothetical protein Tcan_01714 [Toxocara canis]
MGGNMTLTMEKFLDSSLPGRPGNFHDMGIKYGLSIFCFRQSYRSASTTSSHYFGNGQLFSNRCQRQSSHISWDHLSGIFALFASISSLPFMSNNHFSIDSGVQSVRAYCISLFGRNRVFASLIT